VFELALSAKKLSDWSGILNALAQATSLPEVVQFMHNPATTMDEQAQLLLSIVHRLKPDVDLKQIERFIILLAEAKRLLLISAIGIQYEALRAEQEKTMTVSVASFTPLSDTQQQRLIETLTKRLQRRVALEMSIDESLLGGALIQAGDLVIDGSVRGQLMKLASSLAA